MSNEPNIYLTLTKFLNTFAIYCFLVLYNRIYKLLLNSLPNNAKLEYDRLNKNVKLIKQALRCRILDADFMKLRLDNASDMN